MTTLTQAPLQAAPAITVGGNNGYEAEIEIIYNDYLYIKKAKGGDVGNLKLIKIEDE